MTVHNLFTSEFSNDEYNLAFLDRLFARLNYHSKDFPLILVEPPNDKRMRKKLLHLLFEHYEVPSIYLHNSASLAALLHGREHALIIDVGGCSTRVTPVYDSLAILGSSRSEPFGGETIT